MPRASTATRRWGTRTCAVVMTVALAGLLSGCVPPAGGPHLDADAFPLLGSDLPVAWVEVTESLLETSAARLQAAMQADESSQAALGHPGEGIRAITAVAVASEDSESEGETSGYSSERVVPGVGNVRLFGDVNMRIEDDVLLGRMMMGFEELDSAPPLLGFVHDSRTSIPVCPPGGEKFVSGTWKVRHEQHRQNDDGRRIHLEFTVRATLTATAEGGESFDVTGLHTHVRRTDTLPDGRSKMWQGSVEGTFKGLTQKTWPAGLVEAILDGQHKLFTNDVWVREEGYEMAALVAGLSIDVPHAIAAAQRAADGEHACGGWAIVPIEMTNTFLNPLGDVPEVRRWSGFVCGDPFTTAWQLTEESQTFRGSDVDQHAIVPLPGDDMFEGYGVMPRIERVDDPAPGAPPFRLSFEERWPTEMRLVAHQRAYVDVVPAGEQCS